MENFIFCAVTDHSAQIGYIWKERKSYRINVSFRVDKTTSAE